MRWALMKPFFGDRIAKHFIRVDTGTKGANESLYGEFLAQVYDVTVDLEVLMPESNFVFHVGVQSSDFGGKMDNISWL
jgi:hypothetical protein